LGLAWPLARYFCTAAPHLLPNARFLGSKNARKTYFVDVFAQYLPDAATRAGYSSQIAQYAHVLGADRGAIVYMSLAEVQWVYAT
jgi:hypothetical protein